LKLLAKLKKTKMALLKKPKNRKLQNQPRRSSLTSYYRSDPAAETPSPFTRKNTKSKSRKYLIGVVDIIIAAAVIAGIGYSLMVSPQPKIVASNTVFHPVGVYKQAASAQLKHLSNRNKLTFNGGSLAAALKNQFPEITAVQTELPLLSEQPTIRLAIDKPSFFLDSYGTRYVIDSSGKVIALASNLPQITDLPVIEDQSGFKISSGRQVLSANDISFIDTIRAECRRANVPIAAIVIPAVPEELDLRTKDQAYFVKFYLGGDVLSEVGQFLAARQHFKDISQQPTSYLDVRIAGKIFYK
jgi:hypothetical protein